MFQSYEFKEQLCFSYIANVASISRHGGQTRGMSELGVHILSMTSVTSRIVKDPELCKSITNNLHSIMHDFVAGPSHAKKNIMSEIFHSIYDIKYFAKPELLPIIIKDTSILDDMLAAFKEFHFADSIERPDELDDDYLGDRDNNLINLFRAVLTSSPIAIKYLKAASVSQNPELRRVLQTFMTLFASIE